MSTQRYHGFALLASARRLEAKRVRPLGPAPGAVHDGEIGSRIERRLNDRAAPVVARLGAFDLRHVIGARATDGKHAAVSRFERQANGHAPRYGETVDAVGRSLRVAAPPARRRELVAGAGRASGFALLPRERGDLRASRLELGHVADLVADRKATEALRSRAVDDQEIRARLDQPVDDRTARQLGRSISARALERERVARLVADQ